MIVAALLGCTLAGGDPAPTDAERAVGGRYWLDGAVVFAEVITAPRGVPDRFTAGWPPTPADFDRSPLAWPPRTHLRDGLCLDVGATRAGFLARLAEDPEAYWDDALPTRCMRPDYCPWLLHAARSTTPNSAVLDEGLTACDTPEAAEWLSRDGAWSEPLVRWFDRHRGLTVLPRLELALLSLLDTPEPKESAQAALRRLGEAAAPAAGETLLSLHGLVAPPHRDMVALQMWGREDPQIERLHRLACSRHPHTNCSRERRPAGANHDTAVDWLVRDGRALSLRGWLGGERFGESAALLGLDDVVFELIRPAVPVPDAEGESHDEDQDQDVAEPPWRPSYYTLYAYSDGQRFRVLLAGGEIPIIVGLLNAVAQRRGLSQRLGITGESVIVAGTPETLASLAAGGWVGWADPDAIVDTGQW